MTASIFIPVKAFSQMKSDEVYSFNQNRCCVVCKGLEVFAENLIESLYRFEMNSAHPSNSQTTISEDGIRAYGENCT